MEEYINKLKDNPAFLQFEEFVVEKIKELDSVEGLEKMTNESAGEEAKVRSKCKKKLLEVMAPFFNITEKKEPTPEQIADAKKKFNL